MDDAFTCFSARSIRRMNLDGGKMFFRVDPKDPRSLVCIRDAARAVTKLKRAGLPAFVEPMTVERTSDGSYKILRDYANILKDAGAAAALGEIANGTWLKLQYCEGMEHVSRATTLPILMLGGPAAESPEGTIRDFHKGMQAGGNIRGAMVGRNITFVKDDDPRAAAHAISAVIHAGKSPEEAIDELQAIRGKEIGMLTRFAGQRAGATP
jgi:DhnA family fructose-bisphosphate aldolase class Ia